MNSIHLVGLNHRTAGVDVRERYALTRVENFERKLLRAPLRELLALSTCNRVEILAVSDASARPDAVAEAIRNAWADTCCQPVAGLTGHTYAHAGDAAVEHLFRVAASLDSMVLGEPQILGQLKDAYRRAVDAGTARLVVNRLLHKAFTVAKRVRSETAVASSAVSISYAAVELARKIFGELAGRKAMLVGAGEMAELAALHFMNCGIDHVFVANRTFERARELAGRFRGTPVAFGDLFERLAEVDIVVSSTGAPEAVIRARDVKDVLRKRRGRPMFFIDIAVPRDIDPDVGSQDNVYLYDIDDLRDVVEENQEKRRGEAEKAQGIVLEEVAAFRAWQESLALTPTIVELLARGDDLAGRELVKTVRRLGAEDDPAVRQALETLVHSLVRKLYREPIVYLKRRSEEEGQSERFIHMVRRIFDLDAEQVPDDAHLDRKPGQSTQATCPGRSSNARLPD